VGDAGGQQAEGRHLLLVQDVGLGLLEFVGALGDAVFQLRLVAAQGAVELVQVLADALEQQGQGTAGPGHPGEHHDGQCKGGERSPRRRQGQVDQARAEAVQGAGGVGDGRGVADGAADEREEVVVAEGALQAAVAEAQQADEQGLQERDGEGVAAEEDPAAQAEVGVQQGVGGADGQDGVEDGLAPGGVAAGLDQDGADEQAEPADLDHDGLGGHLPGGGDGRRPRAVRCLGHAYPSGKTRKPALIIGTSWRKGCEPS
jgi:hypothetical protein